MVTIFKEDGVKVYKFRDGSIVKDKVILEYIEKLVIPPAYMSVEIYYQANGREPKIKYIGYDDKGRVQAIYSKKWTEQARSIKLCNLVHFGEELPMIMSRMDNHMRSSRMTKNKVIATILKIISICYFRIGNIKYENLYSSHGISTLSKKHIKFLDDNKVVQMSFIGKKGVLNEGTIDDPLTVNVLRDLYNTKSHDQHLFMYQLDGKWNHVTHIDINNWLKEINPIFTSKMFRTFDANSLLISELNNLHTAENTKPAQLSPSKRKKKVVAALNVVAEKVHNTPAISKKSYCDIDMIDMYITQPRKWQSFFRTPSTSDRIKFVNYLKKKCPKDAIEYIDNDITIKKGGTHKLVTADNIYFVRRMIESQFLYQNTYEFRNIIDRLLLSLVNSIEDTFKIFEKARSEMIEKHLNPNLITGIKNDILNKKYQSFIDDNQIDDKEKNKLSEILKSRYPDVDQESIEKCVLRYMGIGFGSQTWKLNDNMLNEFKNKGIDTEAFASPFNCSFDKYYSVFEEDSDFGSMGDFFQSEHQKDEKLYLNPPFIISIFNQVITVLQNIDKFILITPTWTDADFYKKLTKMNSVKSEVSNQIEYDCLDKKNFIPKFSTTIWTKHIKN
jgi:DNA topoisomerase-1